LPITRKEFEMDYTKEQILAMKPGADLDAKVLKELLGCNVEVRVMGCVRYCFCRCEDIDKQVKHQDHEHHWGAAISPSTDISAAWQALETTDFDSVWRVVDPILGDKYCVGYATGVETRAGLICYDLRKHPEECLSPVCSSLPEAICKAALLTKLKND